MIENKNNSQESENKEEINKIIEEKKKKSALDYIMKYPTVLYETLKKLMNNQKFIIFMNILRICFIFWALFMTFILIKEIEAVKLLAYDPCEICMNKTGSMCYLPPSEYTLNQYYWAGFDLTNVSGILESFNMTIPKNETSNFTENQPGMFSGYYNKNKNFTGGFE